MTAPQTQGSPVTPAQSRLGELIDAQDEKLSLCVHCGFCLPVCPTYMRLGDEADSPRGRLYLMRAVVEGRLDPGEDAFQEHMDRCLGCRACETVCPSGVEYGLLLEGARHAATEARPAPAITRLLLAVFGSPGLRGVALFGGRVLRMTGIPAVAARLLPSGGLIGKARLGLAMLAASSPARFEKSGRQSVQSQPSLAAHPAEADDPPTVLPDATSTALLSGCVQEGLFGRVNRATERVLGANGCMVPTIPGQGCCGALHAHAGRIEEARALARVNIDAFYPAIAAGDLQALVVNAAGCGAAMREYGHLLAGDPDYAPRAAAVAKVVRDVSEVLAEKGPRSGGPLPLRVAYDSPCHLEHAQGVVREPLAVLDAIPGLERVHLDGADECCGGAGIYGITHPELGGRIGGDKVDAVVNSGAEVLATGNPGCLMQIGAGLRMRGSTIEVAHPVELLDASYRAAGFYKRT